VESRRAPVHHGLTRRFRCGDFWVRPALEVLRTRILIFAVVNILINCFVGRRTTTVMRGQGTPQSLSTWWELYCYGTGPKGPYLQWTAVAAALYKQVIARGPARTYTFRCCSGVSVVHSSLISNASPLRGVNAIHNSTSQRIVLSDDTH
jgi:hypothetical protein